MFLRLVGNQWLSLRRDRPVGSRQWTALQSGFSQQLCLCVLVLDIGTGTIECLGTAGLRQYGRAQKGREGNANFFSEF